MALAHLLVMPNAKSSSLSVTSMADVSADELASVEGGIFDLIFGYLLDSMVAQRNSNPCAVEPIVTYYVTATPAQ